MKPIITLTFNMDRLRAVGIFLIFAIVIQISWSAQAKLERQEYMVEIRDFKFIPEITNVRPGDTITWTNRDIVPHTATGEGDKWDTGPIGRNESRSLVVTEDRVTSYICRFHPTMKASIAIAPD